MLLMEHLFTTLIQVREKKLDGAQVRACSACRTEQPANYPIS